VRDGYSTGENNSLNLSDGGKVTVGLACVIVFRECARVDDGDEGCVVSVRPGGKRRTARSAAVKI
jgi:hypothetical protein